MVELQIYAAGLRAPEKLMGLDLELGAIPGVRYKADAPHDMIFLESDDPHLAVENIRGIFEKLDLEARFVGQTYPAAPNPSATQGIRP
jgi:hypothetical protein